MKLLLQSKLSLQSMGLITDPDKPNVVLVEFMPSVTFAKTKLSGLREVFFFAQIDTGSKSTVVNRRFIKNCVQKN